jgi:hypothetical protein
MLSPEHRLFDYEDTTMSMMRNVQIVWNCRNARRKAIKEDSPAFKQVTLRLPPFKVPKVIAKAGRSFSKVAESVIDRFQGYARLC